MSKWRLGGPNRAKQYGNDLDRRIKSNADGDNLDFAGPIYPPQTRHTWEMRSKIPRNKVNSTGHRGQKKLENEISVLEEIIVSKLQAK
ncbi:unnamed protein product [Dovyalis caffra]|uniref:Uncharacterized protein n=1 Tax=Dovyalis caffra TaxID=77055 RepID=A0AAV1RTU5_9ROSI|nr:unnamed protein product [Dovyalis caffra]